MTDEKTNEKTDEKNKPKVVTLTESQENLWREALEACRVLGDALTDVGSPIREFALGLTKIQEGEMWIERGFDMLGIDTYGDDGEPDDTDDEPDDTDDEPDDTDDEDE